MTEITVINTAQVRRLGKLTDQRAADLIERACHGRLPVTEEICHEWFLLIAAIRRREHYEIAQRGQKLNALLEQYDRHLRRTRARVRHVSFEEDTESINDRPHHPA
jgi:hypothetical protein